MNSFFFWLSKIRKRPGLHLGEKSLKALMHFWHGYSFREAVERWEKATGRDFFEHYDEAIKSDITRIPDNDFMSGFEEFAYSHYKHETYTTLGWQYLISKNCNSEEEAFDKFFELLEEFFAQKGISMYPQEDASSEGHRSQP